MASVLLVEETVTLRDLFRTIPERDGRMVN